MKTVLVLALAAGTSLWAQETQGFTYTTVAPVGNARVVGAPYTATETTESTQTLADGNKIVHNTSIKVYRDSQGRERREESPTRVVITDPVAETSFRLNPEEHTAQKMPAFWFITGKRESPGIFVSGLGDQTINLKLQPGIPVGTQESLGTQTIEGVTANGTRTTRTIPAGQIGNQLPIKIVDEVWHSPELQLDVMTKHNDPRMGETVYQLTNITRGEPDPSLFQVPPDYKMQGAAADEVKRELKREIRENPKVQPR